MLFRTVALTFRAATVLIAASGTVLAEDKAVSAAQVQALIDRLEKAEARIESLQSELTTVRESQAPRLPDSIGPASTREASSRPVSLLSQVEEPAVDKDAEDEAAVKARLRKLEDKWIDFEERDVLLERSLDNAVLEKLPGTNWQVEGRIHADYWAFPESDEGVAIFEGSDPQDRFTMRRARIGLKGSIKDNMHYVAQLEFAGVDDPEFRDIYIGFNNLPWLQTLRFGNQKRPYGLDHLNSSRFNVFLERPFVIEAFNEDARRIGAVSYGVTDDQAWNWRYGVYNMEKAHPDGQYIGDNYQLEVAGRLANTAWYDTCTDGRSYIHWAVSGTVAHPDGDGGVGHVNESRFYVRPEARTNERWINTDRIAGAHTYGLLGLEGLMNFGPTQLVAELEQVWLDRAPGSSLKFWGGYAYWSYFLTGEHIPWNRSSGTIGRVQPFQNFFLVEDCEGCVESGWGAWNVGVRYSYGDFNDGDILGGEGESLTFALNWHWNANAKLQLNYIIGRIEDRTRGLDPTPPPTTGDYQIFGTRFAVDF